MSAASTLANIEGLKSVGCDNYGVVIHENRVDAKTLLLTPNTQTATLWMALDLKDADDVQVFQRLVDGADVLVENFRPGTLERLGLGPDVLHAINPRLVITRVTGFGQTGPYASRPGFATIAESMSGLSAISGYTDGQPLLPPIALTDELTAVVPERVGDRALRLACPLVQHREEAPALVAALRAGEPRVLRRAAERAAAHHERAALRIARHRLHAQAVRALRREPRAHPRALLQLATDGIHAEQHGGFARTLEAVPGGLLEHAIEDRRIERAVHVLRVPRADGVAAVGEEAKENFPGRIRAGEVAGRVRHQAIAAKFLVHERLYPILFLTL